MLVTVFYLSMIVFKVATFKWFALLFAFILDLMWGFMIRNKL